MPEVSKTPLSAADHFLVGGGIMGEAIRSKDWAATPLGPIEHWPHSLRTVVSLCLASNFPINLIWGPHHVQIYNDGYRPICAGKHPKSLGEDYTKTWVSAWEILAEAFEHALAGETSFLENQRMFLDRNGYLEETFFTFSLSPIRDESGQIGGLFHPVTETTAQMLGQRRTLCLQALASQAGRPKTIGETCELAVAALSGYQLDLPFVLVYLLDENGECARLMASTHLQGGTLASPETIDLAKNCTWFSPDVLANRASRIVTNLSEHFGSIQSGPYPESPDRAFVIPIVVAALDHPAGFLIAALSPRLPLTAEYRAFIELIGAGFTAAVVNAREYEEERKCAEKLAELDRAKTAFFSNVSHEFRTPLTLMLGPLEELLAEQEDEFVAKREAIDLVHRNGLRLLKLVNTLLDFSRTEANRAQAAYEATDLGVLTCDLASLFRSAMEKAGLRLEVQCETLSAPIYVDRDMWEKIVLNLLSNAFKFTLQGVIQVRLEDTGLEVLLSVSDTGTGIPADEIPKLFQRFHRVQGTRGRSYEGTGIGLALVEDLVKLHSGRVWAESSVGVGTTFYVSLQKGSKHLPPEQIREASKVEAIPNRSGNTFVKEAIQWLVTNTNASSNISQAASEVENSTTYRIVLADDNADMQQYIQNILTPEFKLETASDGAKALKIIQDQIPDLVLTDVMMPELDGFGLLKELRGNRKTQGIPVIMLSARAGEEARVEGIEAGADDYLVKPFNARELVARVRVNLELAHLRRELSREEEKRRSSTEIERQWRLFDTALSHTPDSSCIFDLEGRLLYANKALLERWQKLFFEVASKTLAELAYPAEMSARLNAQMAVVIREKLPIHDEAVLVNAKGIVEDYDYVLVPVFGEGDQVEAVAGSSRNVTSLKQTNRALSQANADLKQFAYSASHDLQEPLRMVALYSQMLKKKYHSKLDAQADVIINQCVDGAVRMESMIHDLLAYTQASGIPIAPKGSIAANDVFDSTVSALQVLIRENDASISRGDLPILKVEPVHLTQLFQNLLTNALKYRADRAPVIEVAAQRHAGEWVFSVADNGIGIEEHFRDQIFGLFKRLHTRERYSGTGLGLAICRKLVDHYHGRIWVESEPDRGSTFYFSFPVEESEVEMKDVPKGRSECLLQ